MQNLPEKYPLDDAVIRRINGHQSEKVLVVPTKDGGTYPCAVPELYVTSDGSLLLGIEQEHSELGRGLVQGLWFHLPLTFYLEDDMGTLMLTVHPWRCHITGPLFASALQAARAMDPEADPTAVWELYPQESVETEQPMPKACPLHCTGEPEHHLDHPSLHR